MAFGGLVGLFATLPLGVFLAGIVAVAVLLLLYLGPGFGTKLLALYWVSFCIFSTMLTAYVIGGMFIAFYLALAVALVGYLARDGIGIDATSTWLFVLLFLVVFASLVGYQGSLGGVALDRLLFVPLGVIAALLMASSATPRLLFGAMIASSVAVATWVVVRAAEAGFAYRGSIELDQNVVSYFVGVGFVLCFAWFINKPSPPRRTMLTVLCLLALLLLGYALVLLASRGTFIAIGVVTLVSIVHSVYQNPGRAWRLLLLALIVSSGLFLPGGQGILQRFEDPSTETGGGRVLIWDTVIEATKVSDAAELLFGHGMTSSAKLIRDQFTYLTSTHSSYLLMLYDYGVIGVALFLLLHALVVLRVLRRRDTFGSQVLLLLVFQMSIGLFITASDNYLYWIALGAMLGATSIGARIPRRDRRPMQIAGRIARSGGDGSPRRHQPPSF